MAPKFLQVASWVCGLSVKRGSNRFTGCLLCDEPSWQQRGREIFCTQAPDGPHNGVQKEKNESKTRTEMNNSSTSAFGFRLWGGGCRNLLIIHHIQVHMEVHIQRSANHQKTQLLGGGGDKHKGKKTRACLIKTKSEEEWSGVADGNPAL